MTMRRHRGQTAKARKGVEGQPLDWPIAWTRHSRLRLAPLAIAVASALLAFPDVSSAEAPVVNKDACAPYFIAGPPQLPANTLSAKADADDEQVALVKQRVSNSFNLVPGCVDALWQDLEAVKEALGKTNDPQAFAGLNETLKVSGPVSGDADVNGYLRDQRRHYSSLKKWIGAGLSKWKVPKGTLLVEPTKTLDETKNDLASLKGVLYE